MGKRQDIIKQIQAKEHQLVFERDNYACFVCRHFSNRRSPASDIHEPVSRSKIATRDLYELYSERNMICVCRKCHDIIQADNEWTRAILLKLEELFGYSYPEHIFARYMDA